jgi:predicted O-methyltransferase YrrM
MWRDLATFLYESARWSLDHPATVHPLAWIRDFVQNRRLKMSGVSPLDQGEPWMSRGAVLSLRRMLRPHMRVLEYGCGGSTLFFASQCAEVVSVEHSVEWAGRLRALLQEKGIGNVQLACIPPEHAAPGADLDPDTGFGSSDTEFRGQSFQSYVEYLKTYPPGHFQVIVVDGRARPACLRLAREHLGRGGVLVLDNAERDHYSRCQSEPPLSQWKREDHAGLVCGFFHISLTRIWVSTGTASDI